MPDFPTFTPITTSPFPAFSPVGDDEKERGILGSIIHELGRDIAGVGRTTAAIAFSPFDALGAEVPISLEDLSTRDWIGAAAVASAFAGGAAFSALKGIKAGVGVTNVFGRGASRVLAKETVEDFAKRMTLAQSITLAASSEAAAGAFFGSMKLAAGAEDDLNTIWKDATFFGGFGGAFGMLGWAWRSTVGGRIAALKRQTRPLRMQDMAKRTSAIKELSELSGVQLRNPESGKTLSLVKELSDGRIHRSDGEVFDSFQAAFTDSFGIGYVDNLGLARRELPDAALEGLPKDVRETLQAAQGSAIEAGLVDEFSFRNYQAVRDLTKDTVESDRIFSWLGAETVIPTTNEFGVPEIPNFASFKAQVLRAIPKDEAARIAHIEDHAEFLREATLHGAVDLENLHGGIALRDFTTELIYNDRVDPRYMQGVIARDPYDATFLSKLVTPSTLEKIHPEIAPFNEVVGKNVQLERIGRNDFEQFMRGLEDTIPTNEVNIGVDLIEKFKDLPIRDAREATLNAARDAGEGVFSFVSEVTNRLNTYRLRTVAAGRLGASDAEPQLVEQARRVIGKAIEEAAGDSDAAERLALDAAGALEPIVRDLLDDSGLAGYFPIVNLGGVRLQVEGEAASRFVENFNRALAEGKASGKAFTVTPAFTSTAQDLRRVSGREFARLTRSATEAEGVSFTVAEAAAELGITTGGPRKYSRHLQQRKLGIREFAQDPLTALRFYGNNMERTLAYNTFEAEANAIIGNIPEAKNGLREFMLHQRDLVLGRPTALEQAFDTLAINIFGDSVSPQSLRRYSAMLRHWQGMAKLGGIWSGVVNVTQLALNTTPLLGVRYTTEGIRKSTTRPGRQEIERIAAAHKVDLGLHVGLTAEGDLLKSDSIYGELQSVAARMKIGETKRASRAALDAAQNLWMLSFNEAERFNRLATFWGGYKRAVDSGKSAEIAAVEAGNLVRRTQFDYSVANLPQAMNGPVGAVLGQFKTFFINEVEFIAGLSPSERIKMLISMQALGGVAGLLNLPGVDLANIGSQFLFDQRMDEGLRIKTAQAEQKGEDLGRVLRSVVYGLPGLVSADLTNYVGPGGIADLTRGILGPTGSDATEFGRFVLGALTDLDAVGRVTPDTRNRLLQRVMPAQIRRFQRGWTLFDTGEKRSPYSGKLMYKPDQRLGASVAEGIGVPRVNAGVERALDEVVRRETTGYNRARSSYRKQIALASIQGDAAGTSRLVNEARNSGINITPAQIRRAIEEFQRLPSERRLRRTPRDIRAELEEYFIDF